MPVPYIKLFSGTQNALAIFTLVVLMAIAGITEVNPAKVTEWPVTLAVIFSLGLVASFLMLAVAFYQSDAKLVRYARTCIVLTSIALAGFLSLAMLDGTPNRMVLALAVVGVVTFVSSFFGISGEDVDESLTWNFMLAAGLPMAGAVFSAAIMPWFWHVHPMLASIVTAVTMVRVCKISLRLADAQTDNNRLRIGYG